MLKKLLILMIFISLNLFAWDSATYYFDEGAQEITTIKTTNKP